MPHFISESVFRANMVSFTPCPGGHGSGHEKKFRPHYEKKEMKVCAFLLRQYQSGKRAADERSYVLGNGSCDSAAP